MEQEKKQIYMKWWFWIIIAFIVFVILVNVKSDNSKSNTNFNNTHNSSVNTNFTNNNSTSTNTSPVNTSVENTPQPLDTLVLSYGNSTMNSYIVGKDFAEGKYKVTVNNPTCSGNFIVYKNDVDYETIYHERLGVDGKKEIPEIELKSGNLIEVYKDLIVKIELIK